MPFGLWNLWNQLGTRKYVVDEEPDVPMGRGKFGGAGKRRSIVKYREYRQCWGGDAAFCQITLTTCLICCGFVVQQAVGFCGMLRTGCTAVPLLHAHNVLHKGGQSALFFSTQYPQHFSVVYAYDTTPPPSYHRHNHHNHHYRCNKR